MKKKLSLLFIAISSFFTSFGFTHRGGNGIAEQEDSAEHRGGNGIFDEDEGHRGGNG